MRVITLAACGLLAAAPLVSVTTPARADNDFMGQAQRFLNGNNDNDRDAYERGRQDQLRREQQARDYRHDRWEHDRDWNRDNRYRDPNNRRDDD
jgi:hypothetical protein